MSERIVTVCDGCRREINDGEPVIRLTANFAVVGPNTFVGSASAFGDLCVECQHNPAITMQKFLEGFRVGRVPALPEDE